MIRALSIGLVVLVLLPLGAAGAGAANVPSWTFDLRVSRWVAPSRFAAVVTAQRAGLHVRRGLPVTLTLDRRTRCTAAGTGGVATAIPCATIRPMLAARGSLRVTATGQLETGHLGAIAFRARTVLVQAGR